MKKHNKKLAQAIQLILSGGLTLGAISSASAHVAYNTFNANASYIPTTGGAPTDGWVWGGVRVFEPTPGVEPSAWVGTSDGKVPFGYTGAAALNWTAHLDSAGASATVSQQDAYDRYGVYADIDTAAGAWQDTGFPQGWAHNTDIGLLKSDVTQYIHLTPSVIVGNQFANFGITVFEGQSLSISQGGSYNHHLAWNRTKADPFNDDVTVVGQPNPFGIKGLDTVVGWDDTVDINNPFTFLAEAGEVYSIFLGGSGGVSWSLNHDGYALDITTSAVPVPGAVWLFGSAAAGLAGYRRKQKSDQ